MDEDLKETFVEETKADEMAEDIPKDAEERRKNVDGLLKGAVEKRVDTQNDVPKNEKNDTKSTDEKSEEIIDISEDYLNSLANDANKYFLLRVLSPEVKENEEKKREHKNELMQMMRKFLSFQFCFTAGLVAVSIIFIMVCHACGRSFSDSTLKTIFTFVGAYITSVVVELIAILNYIVQKVFDTSVADLVAIFKDNETKKVEDK